MATESKQTDSYLKVEIDNQVAKGDDSGICSTFKGLTQVILSGTAEFNWDPQDFEAKLHLLWYILIQGAANLGPETLDQYHMVYTILYLCQLGPLSQVTDSGREPILIENKRLWTDLPYLFHDVKTAWNAKDRTMTSCQKENFAAFLAQMLAVGICEEDLVALARDSFDRALQEASIASQIENLYIVLMWFTFAGDKLTKMSGESIHGLGPEGWRSLHWLTTEM